MTIYEVKWVNSMGILKSDPAIFSTLRNALEYAWSILCNPMEPWDEVVIKYLVYNAWECSFEPNGKSFSFFRELKEECWGMIEAIRSNRNYSTPFADID